MFLIFHFFLLSTGGILRTLCPQWLGVDIRQDLVATKPIVHNLAAFMCSDFFARLLQLMMAKRSELWLLYDEHWRALREATTAATKP